MNAPSIVRHAVIAGITALASLHAAHASADLDVFVPNDFPTIQAALDALPDGGQPAEIYLAPGIYHENIDASGKNVSIIGDPNKPYTVTIDGLGTDTTVFLGTVDEPYTVNLIGITVTGGIGRLRPVPNVGHTYGGGIHLQPHTNLYLAYSTVRNNSSWYGGGIYANNDTNLVLFNSEIRNNSSEFVGGGVSALSNLDVDGCTFDQNQSLIGAHICTHHLTLLHTEIKNSTFTNGFAAYSELTIDFDYNAAGGAIALHAQSDQAVIRGCTFDHNVSARLGGAISCTPYLNSQHEACADGTIYCPHPSVLVEDCSFSNCMAMEGGAIMWSHLGELEANRLTFYNCSAEFGGGFCSTMGTHSIQDSTFDSCSTLSGGQGGAVFCDSSALTLQTATIEACRSLDGVGGGIALRDASLTLRDCTLTSNESQQRGSGLYALRSSVSDQRSVITNHIESTAVYIDMDLSNNTSEFIGTLFERNGFYAEDNQSQGAVALERIHNEQGAYQPRMRFVDCTFNHNGSDVYGGGAIRSDGVDAEIKLCTFFANYSLDSSTDGGALHFQDANAEITNTTFSGNFSEGHGGAIYLADSMAAVVNSTFNSNYAARYGGSIESRYGSQLSVNGCHFQGVLGNAAEYGGAIDIDESADTTSIIASSFTGCAVSGAGGAIYTDGPDTYIFKCRIQNNHAGAQGGGFYTTDGNSQLEQSLICGNTHDQVEGAYQDLGGNLVSDFCCDGDLTGDGLIDGADLTVLLSAWGSDNPVCDLDHNGTVDGSDLTRLLAAWGKCDY